TTAHAYLTHKTSCNCTAGNSGPTCFCKVKQVVNQHIDQSLPPARHRRLTREGLLYYNKMQRDEEEVEAEAERHRQLAADEDAQTGGTFFDYFW
ncbi:hypothetical protein LSAT2_010091, partial [Lamellibrachia satsuma]